MKIEIPSLITLLCLSIACESPPETGAGGGERFDQLALPPVQRAERGRADQSVRDAMRPASSDLRLDQGKMADAVLDSSPDQQLRPDGMVAYPISDCESACDYFSRCQVIGDRYPAGGEGECLTRCARAAETRDLSLYFQCIEGRSCASLSDCQDPIQPTPSCAESCAAFSECGESFGREGESSAECEASCEAIDGARCGLEFLLSGCGARAEARECVAGRHAPECVARCALEAGCGLAAPSCISRCYDALEGAEPLQRIRQRGQLECTEGAESCLALARCAALDLPTDAESFCAAYEACALTDGATGRSCEALLDEFGRGQRALGCGRLLLAGECPESYFELLPCWSGSGTMELSQSCQRLCDGAALCELSAPGEQDPSISCRDWCAWSGERPEPARWLSCEYADSCARLEDCLAPHAPTRRCEARCALSEGCRTEGEEGRCIERCLEGLDRPREAARIACLESRGCGRRCLDRCAPACRDCADACEIEVPPSPPCREACARLRGCGVPVPEECALNCETEALEAQTRSWALSLCVLHPDACEGALIDDRVEGVSACISAAEPPPRALDCAAFCRATSDCSGDRAALSPCLTRCLAHFPEADDERGDLGPAVDQGAPLDQRLVNDQRPAADRGEAVAADQGREAGSPRERQRFEAARACLSALNAEERERCAALTGCL